MPEDSPAAPGSVLRFPQVIDNTIRSAFVLCPQQWFRRHCQGLIPAGAARSVHLHFGGCFARGLEAARLAHYRDGASPTSALHAGITAALREWGDIEYDPHTQSEAVKTIPALIDALDTYFAHYPLSADALRPLDLPGVGLLVEKTFCVEIPGTRHPDTGEPIQYGGRCDMVALNRDSDTIWIVDEKTASRLGDTWADKWSLHAQPTGYTWGYRQYGISPSGAIMRGVGILSSSITFAESIQSRPPWKVDQWLSQLRRDVARMVTAYGHYKWGGLEPDRALGDACFAYNKPCPYLPLCNTHQPERWLPDYEVNYWEPLTLGQEADQ